MMRLLPSTVRSVLVRGLLPAGLAVLLLTSCGSPREDRSPEEEEASVELLTVGFSQLGAESDWRSANTESMKAAFSGERGFDLVFEDGQQKQVNQIKAIRVFIQREVDYILLAPVTETGWDTVLMEAKGAGIPVILVDRMVDVEDEELFTCWIGSDFEAEGRKAAEWLRTYADLEGIRPGDLHIVNIQGTIGATAQIGRTRALEEAALREGWDLLEEVSGEFTQAKGREVMASLLDRYDNINVVYCENDNEALGAIEAIEAAGRRTGTDLLAGEIMVISFDGVKKEALEYVREGKIACIAQCNPDQGELASDLVRRLEAGEIPEKRSFVEEGIYSALPEISSVTVDGVSCPVVSP